MTVFVPNRYNNTTPQSIVNFLFSQEKKYNKQQQSKRVNSKQNNNNVLTLLQQQQVQEQDHHHSLLSSLMPEKDHHIQSAEEQQQQERNLSNDPSTNKQQYTSPKSKKYPLQRRMRPQRRRRRLQKRIESTHDHHDHPHQNQYPSSTLYHHRQLYQQTVSLYRGYGTHYVDLWCGTPPQRQTVIVDTGSATTAFRCHSTEEQMTTPKEKGGGTNQQQQKQYDSSGGLNRERILSTTISKNNKPPKRSRSAYNELESTTFQKLKCSDCIVGECHRRTIQQEKYPTSTTNGNHHRYAFLLRRGENQLNTTTTTTTTTGIGTTADENDKKIVNEKDTNALVDEQCEFAVSYEEGSQWSAYEAMDVCYIGGYHHEPVYATTSTSTTSNKGGKKMRIHSREKHDVVDVDTKSENEHGTTTTTTTRGEEEEEDDEKDTNQNILPHYAANHQFKLHFGCQIETSGHFNDQYENGIMGLGNGFTSIWNQLYLNHKIKSKSFSLCFNNNNNNNNNVDHHEPIIRSTEISAGALTFGGTDTRLHANVMVYSSSVPSEEQKQQQPLQGKTATSPTTTIPGQLKDGGENDINNENDDESNNFFHVHIRKIYLREGGGGTSIIPTNNKNSSEQQSTENSMSGIIQSDLQIIPVEVTESLINEGQIILDSGTTDTYFVQHLAIPFRKAWKELVGQEYSNRAVTMTAYELSMRPTIILQLKGDIDMNQRIYEEYDQRQRHRLVEALDEPIFENDQDEKQQQQQQHRKEHIPFARELDPEHPYDILIAIPPSRYYEYQIDTRRYVPGVYLEETVGSVLGANVMQNHDVYFDLDHQRIGWTESTCDYPALLEQLQPSHHDNDNDNGNNNNNNGGMYENRYNRGVHPEMFPVQQSTKYHPSYDQLSHSTTDTIFHSLVTSYMGLLLMVLTIFTTGIAIGSHCRKKTLTAGLHVQKRHTVRFQNQYYHYHHQQQQNQQQRGQHHISNNSHQHHHHDYDQHDETEMMNRSIMNNLLQRRSVLRSRSSHV